MTIHKAYRSCTWAIVAAGLALNIASAQALQAVRLQGGGSINLPAGWSIALDQQGMVGAKGPQGRIELGLYVGMYTPQQAAQTVRIYGPAARPPYVGPYESPNQALVELLVSAKQATRGSVRMEERSIDRNWTRGYGENVVFTNYTLGEKCLASVLTAPTGPGQFMFYESSVCAPIAQFSRSLVTLLRIWSSWHIGDQVFQDRLQQTAMSMNSVSTIIQGVAARKQAAGVNNAQIWDKIIKGCSFPSYKPSSPYCEIPESN